MPHEIQDPERWKRLARELIFRRIQLGWRTRAAFVEEHVRNGHLRNGRNIDAIETAERMNFDPSTLRTVELIYGWKVGSVDEVLADREPHPIDEGVAVIHEPAPAAASADRMECRFIIDRLDEDQLPEALGVLRRMERRQR